MVFPIREVWAKEIARNLDLTLGFKQFVNTSYTGELVSGGVVNVVRVGDITVSDYVPNGGTVRQNPEPTVSSMAIDKMKYFDFGVDNANEALIGVGVVAKYAQRASYAIAKAVDTGLYTHRADVFAGNILGTDVAPVAVTKTNIVEQLVALETRLNIAGASGVNRWVAVSSEFAGVLKNTIFEKTVFANDGKAFTGFLGQIGSLRVFELGTVRPVDGVHNILCGSGDFIAYADGVTNVKTYEPESGFANAVKGLYVYGSKVFEGKEGALLKCTIA